jgi:hypothetical protein
MKTRWLFGVLGGALLITGVALAQEAAKTAPPADAGKKAAPGTRPVMEVPRLNYDFGETFHLEKYGYAFVVRNRGNADLVIEDVKPGCGCTAAKFDRLVAPGKEGKIELVVGESYPMKIIKLAPAERKIGLSIRALKSDEFRADWESYQESSGDGSATLGDPLRNR